MIKKILAMCLASIMVLQCCADAFAEVSIPQEYANDGVVYAYNADGTITATIYTSPVIDRSETSSDGEERLEDHGDSYVSTAEDVAVSFEKVYTEGEMLVSISCDGTGILFYPETNPGANPEKTDEEDLSAVHGSAAPEIDGQTDSPVFSESPVEEHDTELASGVCESPYSEDSVCEEAEAGVVEDSEGTVTGAAASEVSGDITEQAEQPPTEESPKEEPSSGSTSTASEDVTEQAEQPPTEESPKEEPSSGSTSTASGDTAEQTEQLPVEGSASTTTVDAEERSEPASILQEESDVTSEAVGEEVFPVQEASSRKTSARTVEWEPAQVFSSVAGVGTGYTNGTYSGVCYPGAINEYTDVELFLQDNGVKENIVMRRYTTSEISYVLDFDGLTPVLSGNTIALYDMYNAMVGEISAPYLLDADGAYNDDIKVALYKEGRSCRLVYTMDESWLLQAAYPVVLDPSTTYIGKDNEGHSWNNMEDGYVTSAEPNRNYGWTSWQLQCGNTSGEALCLFRPVFPESINAIADSILVKDVKLYTYVESVRGANTYSIYQLLGDWSSKTVTYNNCPAYISYNAPSNYIASAGWYTWDLTAAASTWFNCLDQMQEYGILIRGQASGGSLTFASSDPWSNNAYFTITYYPVAQSSPKDPNLVVTPMGNALNSGTGYLNLNWTAVEGAEGYYVGIHNGKEYEYFFVGNTTTWTTQGEGIWPTESEISSGRYRLHHDGAGSELPMIPAFTYNNSGGALAGILSYSICVIPANRYGQAPNPMLFGTRISRLPDRLAPSSASSITIEPDVYTNANTITMTWSGIVDYNATDTGAVSSLGTGSIQYAINDTNNWTSTGISNGNGSASVDVSSSPDGRNALYLRAVDSAGNSCVPQYLFFYIDRAAPTAPLLSIVPNEWSQENSISITWSGINDLNDLSCVEYSVDGSEYITTGHTEAAYSGYIIDIASLADGEHTVSVRGIDRVGNVGVPATVSFYRDTTEPSVDYTTVEPSTWTNKDEISIAWTNLKDAHSGLHLVWRCTDGGAQIPLDAAEDLTTILDISALSDGEHTVLLHFEDQVGNSIERELFFYRDASTPDLAILSPTDGSTVNGTVDVIGSVTDLSLASWKLVAVGEDGTEHVLSEGTTGMGAELLGTLNCALFEDREQVELRLYAIDMAGNEAQVSGTVIVVDKSAQPISGTVTINAPGGNEVLTTPSISGSYIVEYERPQTKGLLYIDGVYQGETDGKTFPFYGVSYAENSTHSISVLSLADDGTMQFSQGLSACILYSDSFEDDSFLSAHSSVAFQHGVSLVGGSAGTVCSQSVQLPFPILSLRLIVTEEKPAGTDIQYAYSTDGGNTWVSLLPDTDVPMLARPKTIMVRAELIGDGTNTPSLRGLTLQGVIETNPTRVIVKLLRPVEQIALNDAAVTRAVTPLAGAPENASLLRQYWSGQYTSDSFSFDARSVAENESRTVALIAESSDGTFYGTGARTSILLRESVAGSGTVTSDALKADGKLYAIRLEVSYSGSARFSYSVDGQTWTPMSTGIYTYLPEASDAVYVRAEGGSLRAWHVEGVTCTESHMTVQILQAPVNVTAADWGADYYGNEKLRYYELSWADETPEDTTAAYSTSYEIYRNDELIASTGETRYIDHNYDANARYEVRAVRTYTGFDAHVSTRSAAGKTSMRAPERLIGVSYSAEEQDQSEYLNNLYGGNYTFSSLETAPVDERSLDMSLLGRNRICAYGFEPVNFNTGNFLLEAEDYRLTDLGLAFFAVDRTYNSRSDAVNGLFGARWSSTWNEHLLLYAGGDITYIHADGAEIIFHRYSNGSYYGGESRGLTLTANGSEYRITDLNGEIHAFTGMGLLKYVQWPDGNKIELLRNMDGFITALVLPSGLTLPVEHDTKGHVTAIETPAGTLRYEYQGNLLASFTDTDGKSTRYVYDGAGHMTEWYDAAGTRQVKNTYDARSRVIRQIDANGGEYTLEYYNDHTVTTDAEGRVSEIWYDELGRTLKTVDAEGAVVTYSYDANSNIVAITDALGNTTRYEYDAFGNKVKEIAPDGSSYSLQYDANNNLTQLTDPRGGVTRYEYDEHNRLVRQINPDGGVIAYTYNEAGQVLTVTDPLGAVTAYEYDGADLVRSVDPNGSVTTYAYDGRHRLVSTTDALGNTTFFSYDGQDNLISVTFADDTSFTYEYDAVGNLVSQTDALGNTTRFEYDALRQLVKTIYPDGSEATSAYDHSGNLIAAVDAAGGEAAAAYDGRGRIITLTDALGNSTTYTYDLCGNLISQTLANGAETVYTYDANGRLASVTAPTGETTRYAYDAAGNLVSVTAPDGGVTKYGYDEMGRLISETDPLGAVTTYAYDAAGRLSTRTDANGGITVYTFDPNGNLLTVTDALGGVTTYAYDALNRVVSMTDANGATTTYAYDAVGNLISQTDALGNTTAYAYDANGSITGLTDALGGKSAMTYDELGNVIAVLQKNGGRVSAEYDPLGRLQAETDALGNVTAYEYDANGRVTRITDALGQSAEIAYDATGNVTGIHAPDGSVTTYAYDLAGRLIGETSPIGAVTRYTYSGARLTATSVNGNITRYTYDLAGNITSVTDAEGRRIELCYDALGNLTAVLYPDGTQDAYEYDALSRLVRYVPRLGDATEYTYNAMGDVLTVTVGGQTTRYEYDLLGRVTATVTADGARTELSYDALGNLTKTVDALGNETSYAYTVDGLLEAVTYANGATLTASYDLLGNLISETDPLGAVTAYEYDPLGRLTAVTDALGCTTRYAYDAADRLTKVTDALGHVTRYTYDANGNLTSETDALGNTVRYSYTPEGWLETVTDAEGHITRYTYDRTGSVLTADYAGEQFETNAYNELGLLTTVTTAEGDTLYQYDEAGRLISVTQPNGETVSYTYDSHGNRTSMTYPDGKTVSYTYDEMNRLVAVKGVDGKTTRYSYDALGRRIATDGVKEDTVYVYDAVGNLVSQTTTGKLELSFEYVYDLAGRMTQESRAENGATLISSYLYDAIGQLTAFTRSDGLSETYTYDTVGNMTAKTQGGVQTAMRYNAANQLTQSVTNGDTTTYTYDANGSLVRSENAGGARSYAYNALGLLSQFIREDGYTETYSYNANRLLSSITTGEDLTTTLTWDILYGGGVVIGAAQNGQATSYTYGLERISALTGKIRTEYAYDGRGSVAAEISYNTAWYTFGGLLARKNVTSMSYTPFGEQIGEATSGFGYNGEYYSAATGMIYLRARFYAPEMKRFGQKDLVRGSAFAPQSLNRYGYCQNNPVNYCDPSGETLKSLLQSAKEYVSTAISAASDVVQSVGTTLTSAAKTAVSTFQTMASVTMRSIADAGKTVGKTLVDSIHAKQTIPQTLKDIVGAMKDGAITVGNGIRAAGTVFTSGAKSVSKTISDGVLDAVNVYNSHAPALEKAKDALSHQIGTSFGNILLAIEKMLSLKYPFIEYDRELIESNYTYNSEIEIPDGILNNQYNGPEGDLILGYPGMKPKLFQFVENYPYTSDTGCEAIAVRNALSQGLGIDMPLADIIRQFEGLGAVTWAPFVRYGELGSNPYSIGSVLYANGAEYKRVYSIEGMSVPGTYIMSFWNSDSSGLPSLMSGVHTIALEVNSDGTIQPFNLSEKGPDNPLSPEAFSLSFESSFITGYYLGKIDKEGED